MKSAYLISKRWDFNVFKRFPFCFAAVSSTVRRRPRIITIKPKRLYIKKLTLGWYFSVKKPPNNDPKTPPAPSAPQDKVWSYSLPSFTSTRLWVTMSASTNTSKYAPLRFAKNKSPAITFMLSISWSQKVNRLINWSAPINTM